MVHGDIYVMNGYHVNCLLCSTFGDCKTEMNLVNNKENDIYWRTDGGATSDNKDPNRVEMASKISKIATVLIASNHKRAGKYHAC